MKTTILYRSLSIALIAVLVGGAFLMSLNAQTSAPRVTLTGMSKAIATTSTNRNQAQPNATLTVSGGDVYQVYGWAGIICATKADGKKVEVDGVIGQRDGKKTITAKSIDVKIIVVD